jgi:hypothetical protein
MVLHGETKLIIIHYYWSEGQILPITAEAGRAQTVKVLIQLYLRQTRSKLHGEERQSLENSKKTWNPTQTLNKP